MKGKKKLKTKSLTPGSVGPIFCPEGRPLRFTIAFGDDKRAELISVIKAHGGEITSSIEADYVSYAVIRKPPGVKSGSKRMKEFETYVTTAHLHGVPPVSFDFVLDSVARGKLLEHKLDQYTHEMPGNKKRKRTVELESEDESEDEKPLAAAKQLKKEATPAAAPVSPPKKAPARRKSLPASPAKPKATGKVLNAYLTSEMDRAAEIALEFFTEDPDATNTSLGHRLHAELPRHSFGSWQSTIGYPKHKHRFERARKLGGIRHRKIKEEAEAERRRLELAKSSANSMPVEPAQPQPTPSPQMKFPTIDHAVPNAYEQDLNDIVEFFVAREDDEFGSGDEREAQREAIFDKLASKSRCRTKANWAAFHAEYFAQVQEQVDRREAPEE